MLLTSLLLHYCCRADLVLLEYSVNGYGGQCQCFTSPQTAGYETLLRKIIKKAPRTAMLAFASFMWLDKENKPGKFYETGEDQHGVVCRRYGEYCRRDTAWKTAVFTVQKALYKYRGT
jgi:hypothetical protein